jgi:hypothetical protein
MRRAGCWSMRSTGSVSALGRSQPLSLNGVRIDADHAELTAGAAAHGGGARAYRAG